jgi:hypothetical protein
MILAKRKRFFAERNEVIYYFTTNAIVEGELHLWLHVFVT